MEQGEMVTSISIKPCSVNYFKLFVRYWGVSKTHLQQVHRLHEQDLEQGYGRVYLPLALERKDPNAAKEWMWQYVFPSLFLSTDPKTGIVQRHHLHASGLQKATKQANISKQVSCHTFRHSFATHLLQNGYDIHAVQELMGHRNVKTTMIYTRVMTCGERNIISPLD
jgi:integrase